MPPSVISLPSWHTRLEKHFRDLCAARKLVSGHAVYALEHGLVPDEREQLLEAVRAAVLARFPSDVFWLPYVVYAAEIGYEFAGEEYWQTFEDRTPGWDRNRGPRWLREMFQKFARMFGGAVPQGAWAKHFSIICWPITHAVLPRDLQQQLAATLHDLRWSLQIEHLTDPLALGAAISARSRFQNSRVTAFTDDAALIGQIASALLLNDAAQTLHLIHPATLERIAGDLDKQRVAREWLYEARRQAARVTLRGTLPASRPAQQGSPNADTSVPAAGVGRHAAGQRQPSLGIDPRVILRPAQPSGWTVHLEIPDLQHLLDSPEWTEVLTMSRCRVAGGGKRPLAPGRLLHGVQMIHLERWPGGDEVLLAFDAATPPVQAALKTTALLSPRPWLFKLAADGRAYHIRGCVFRPGAEYLLVSDTPMEYDRYLVPADVRCAGVQAARLSVPPFVPANLEGVLRDYGISRASSIRVAPAGLPPLFWDGEGHAEWLATDTPVLSVERETDSEEIELVLDGSPDPVRIPVTSDGPVFVELPGMQPGVHVVRVHARSADGRIASARLEVTIRPPRPWKGVLGEQHAVQITVAPAQATMEDLLSGRFRLEARGPDGLRVESDVRLWDYRRQKQLYRKSLTGVRLPFDTGAWHRAFVDEFLDAPPVQQELDQAWAVEVDLSFGAIASQRLLFVRHLAPLRWSVRNGKRGYDLFLTDDTGAEGVASVQFRSFREPATPVQLVLPAQGVGLTIPDGGGLIEAIHGSERALAVVAPPGLRDLGALRVEPVLAPFHRAADGMSALLQLAALWADATPHGSRLARLRQCEVLRALHCCLVDALCGSRWRNAERKFLDGGLSIRELAKEVSSLPADAEFRKALMFTPRRFTGLQSHDRADSLAGTVSMLRDRKARSAQDVALALELMSVPERLPRLEPDRWSALLGDGTLMRAARFVVIAIHKEADGQDITALPLYAGWN